MRRWGERRRTATGRAQRAAVAAPALAMRSSLGLATIATAFVVWFVATQAAARAGVFLAVGREPPTLHRFPAPEGTRACAAESSRVGELHALLIGVNEYVNGLRLEGSVNDVQLLSAALRERGMGLERIQVLVDAYATRTAVLAALDDVVRAA